MHSDLKKIRTSRENMKCAGQFPLFMNTWNSVVVIYYNITTNMGNKIYTPMDM
jgi:hypothetical protein